MTSTLVVGVIDIAVGVVGAVVELPPHAPTQTQATTTHDDVKRFMRSPPGTLLSANATTRPGLDTPDSYHTHGTRVHLQKLSSLWQK